MGKRILLVDDNNTDRNHLKRLLDEMGHEVVAETARGGNVITEFVNSNPDVVLLDIVLSDKSGLDIIRILANIAPDVKIIACSASDNEFFIKQSFAEGAKGYLLKPITKEKLQRELDSI